MSKKTELVVLSITYDDAAYQSPQKWDWNALCDLPDPVVVLPKLPTPPEGL